MTSHYEKYSSRSCITYTACEMDIATTYDGRKLMPSGSCDGVAAFPVKISAAFSKSS